MNITLTSLEAYHETIMSGRADTMRMRVLEAVRCFGPASDKELSRITGIPENTIRPRRGELAKLGMIQVEGVSNEGPGRRKTLWRITVR